MNAGMRALTIASCLAASSCAASPVPCNSATVCGAEECLANRCVAPGSDPVPAGTRRVVIEPRAVATLGSPGGAAARSVVLGGEHGDERLYLGFDALPGAGGIRAAFLLLEPAEAAAPNREDVPLEVWTIKDPWSAERAARGARPRLGGPMAEGIARSSPGATSRIDVTALFREDAGRGYGLAVVSRGSRGSGVALASGTGAGSPRLEFYLARD